jgi:erythromycin esterase-like protein
MFETLTRLLEHRGRDSKAIVWAHNSHVGDAQATNMGWSRKEPNIRQLCKERFRVQAVSIGTGTNTGTLAAAQDWDGNMNIMELQPRLPGSYKELMHAAGSDNFVDLCKGKCDEKLRETLNEKRLERFIGVLYRPETEKASHYLVAVLPEQFDSFIWFDKSKHLGTCEVHQPKSPRKYHETWPFGLWPVASTCSTSSQFDGFLLHSIFPSRGLRSYDIDNAICHDSSTMSSLRVSHG